MGLHGHPRQEAEFVEHGGGGGGGSGGEGGVAGPASSTCCSSCRIGGGGGGGDGGQGTAQEGVVGCRGFCWKNRFEWAGQVWVGVRFGWGSGRYRLGQI